ncbi:methylenetetrahydrofolate reductase [Stetteria hydrogenophila]
MELLVEIEPTRSAERLSRLASAARLADWVDVPESPMGVPRSLSLLVAHKLQCSYGLAAIPHVRVIDHNLIAVKSIIGSLGVAGFRRIVFLRGDTPEGATYLNDVAPEEAAGMVRERYAGSVEAGLILSMRKPLQEVVKRLAKADFFLVTNADYNWERYVEASREARRLGVKLYPYVIVETPGNQGLLERLGIRTPWRLGRIREAVEKYWGLASGILLSAPGDPEGLAEAVREARMVAGGG